MPHFNLRFLVWRTRVAVVYPRPPEPFPVRHVLDVFRVGELTPVFRENHREQSSEILSPPPQPFPDLCKGQVFL